MRVVLRCDLGWGACSIGGLAGWQVEKGASRACWRRRRRIPVPMASLVNCLSISGRGSAARLPPNALERRVAVERRCLVAVARPSAVCPIDIDDAWWEWALSMVGVR